MNPLRSCLLLAAALLTSCAPAAPEPTAPTPAAPASVAPTTVAPPVVASSAPVASASAAAPVAPTAPEAPAVPVVELGKFSHDISEPIVSLAMGEPRVAALGAEPWIRDKGAWKKTPLPERLRPKSDEKREARIFFGRDDKPRIMGAKIRDGKAAQLYLRYRNEAWNEERGEMAKLRDLPVAGMFGVLGHADPEVVCKVGDDCIIKRRSGWKMLPAGNSSPRIEVQHGIAWMLQPDGVARLEDDKRWVAVGAPAPFKEPAGICALNGDVWVSEPGAGRVHHLRGGSWASEPSPLTEPRGLWCAGPDDVWLTGAEGLAHHDGKRWSRVAGPTGPLTEVYTRGPEVWAAGPSGVWSRPAP